MANAQSSLTADRIGDGTQRGSRLVCPHCKDSVPVAVDSQDDVVCPTCGNSFHLDTRQTLPWSPETLPRLGKFQLMEVVGRGGCGTVYRAMDTELDRQVAIKIPRAGHFTSDEDQHRFLGEGRAAAQLKHPGIVAIHEVGRHETLAFIVSEFVEGATLAQTMALRRFGFRESAELIAQAAEALEHSHEQGIVHRDLKPSNLMLQGDCDLRVRVMDFGLARRDEVDATVTLDGQVLGTPAYMSPEQARGESRRVDRRSDVYSLGVILYELLTGELPFRGSSRMMMQQVQNEEPRAPRSLNDRIPRDLETICLRAMAKEPARRYATAGDMAADLRRYLRNEPVHARPVGRLERAWRWTRRNPWLASLSAAVVLLLATVAAGSTVAALSLASARRDVEAQLGESLYQQSRAHWLSHQPGWREASLAAAGRAAAIQPNDRTRNAAVQAIFDRDLRQRAELVHNLPVTAAAFAPDGRRVAFASGSSIYLWDVGADEANAKPAAIHQGRASISQLRISDDGKHLLAGADDGKCWLWRLAEGKAELVDSFAVHETPVHDVVFGPGPDSIASTDGKEVALVRLSTGKLLDRQNIPRLVHVPSAPAPVPSAPAPVPQAEASPSPGPSFCGEEGELVQQQGSQPALPTAPSTASPPQAAQRGVPSPSPAVAADPRSILYGIPASSGQPAYQGSESVEALRYKAEAYFKKQSLYRDYRSKKPVDRAAIERYLQQRGQAQPAEAAAVGSIPPPAPSTPPPADVSAVVDRAEESQTPTRVRLISAGNAVYAWRDAGPILQWSQADGRLVMKELWPNATPGVYGAAVGSNRLVTSVDGGKLLLIASNADWPVVAPAESTSAPDPAASSSFRPAWSLATELVAAAVLSPIKLAFGIVWQPAATGSPDQAGAESQQSAAASSEAAHEAPVPSFHLFPDEPGKAATLSTGPAQPAPQQAAPYFLDGVTEQVHLMLVDLESGAVVDQLLLPLGQLASLAPNADQTVVAVAGRPGSVSILRVSNRRLVVDENWAPVPHLLDAAQLSAAGAEFLTVDAQRRLRIFQRQGQQSHTRLQEAMPGWSQCHLDSRSLTAVVAGHGRDVSVYDVNRQIGWSGLNRFDVRAVSLSRDRSVLAMITDDQRLEVAQIAIVNERLRPDESRETGSQWLAEQRSLPLLGHPQQIAGRVVLLSPHGRYLALGGYKAPSLLWQLDDAGYRFVREFGPAGGIVHEMAFDAQGERLAVASLEGALRLWNVEDGVLLAEAPNAEQPLGGMNFSDDGALLVCGSIGGKVTVWNTQSLTRLAEYGDNTESWCAAFSPQAAWLVVGHRDGSLALYDRQSARRLLHWQGHEQGITAVAFAVDREEIVSCDNRGAIRAWKLDVLRQELAALAIPATDLITGSQ